MPQAARLPMELDRALIEKHLLKLAMTPEFSGGVKIKALLRYLVDAALDKKTSALKGYTIGVDVFNRGTGFDPNVDSIVRVQVGRLRKALAHYYLTSGAEDPVRIIIPKGGYKVEFIFDPKSDNIVQHDVNVEQSKATSLKANPNTIAIAVLPFTARKGNSEQNYFAEGLSDELMTRLARVKSLSLSPRSSTAQHSEPTDLQKVGASLGANYIIDGNMQQSGNRLRVTIQLIDAATTEQIWAQTYNRIADDIFSVHDELISNMIMELRLRIYNRVRDQLEQKSETATSSAWELFMRSNWTPNAGVNSLAREKKRVAIAQHAVEIDAKSGKAHSVLADKLSYLAVVDPTSDTTERHIEADYHARRALEFDPIDADVLFNVFLCYWHAGRLKEGLGIIKRTLELEPNHILAYFLVKTIPFANTRAPQEVIDDLITYSSELAGDNHARWVALTWTGMLYFNNGNYDQAAEYSWRTHEIFKTPESRYRLAASLIKIGEKETAVDLIFDAIGDWPTLDLYHYANVAVPRRLGDGQIVQRIQNDYLELATTFANACKAQNKLKIVRT